MRNFQKIRRGLAGFATLETAMITTALFGIFLGAVGLFDYLNRIDAVQTSLDHEIHNSSVKPLTIETDPIRGGFTIDIDHVRLRRFVEHISENISATSTEVAYSIADIDPTSGRLTGVRPPTFRAANGNLNPPRSASCPGLQEELMALSSGSNGSQISNLAIPSGGSSQAESFLRETVLVVARAAIDFSEAPLTGKAIRLMGINPIVTVCSATLLRGEVSVSQKATQ